MDEVREGLALGHKAMTLVDKVFGPGLARRQADADSRSAIQGVLTEQLATYMESHPNDPVLMDAIIASGGKLGLTNLAQIVQQATPQMNEHARPDLISGDWGANFRDKSRTCSDPDMATLWAQLLAGEANNPGSYSRKTVNILGNMEPRDAELFNNLCRFQIMVNGVEVKRIPLVLREMSNIYERHGVTRSSLLALHDLQLINFADVRIGAIGLGASIRCLFFAHSDGMVGLLPNDGSDDEDKFCQIDIGSVSFTKAGTEMSNLCLPLRTPDGFVDFLISEWGDSLRRFTVERWPMTVNFRNGTLQVRPDLDRIVE